MTGFGRSQNQNGATVCRAEIRSVNNRFLEVSTRLPKSFQDLERPLKKLIRSQCARGSFDLNLAFEDAGEGSSDQILSPNLPLAGQYVRAYAAIRQEFNLSGEIDINTLLGIRDVVKAEPVPLDPARQELALATAQDALNFLLKMRAEEGAHLKQDIVDRLNSIVGLTELIKGRQELVIEEYQVRLREKIKVLTQGMDLDEGRLAQEVAVLADRSDVTEEITRMESHFKQFLSLLEAEGPVGRKLEFITQEFNRETNTIGSKTVDAEVTRAVIEIKSDLEKIREQLANIE